MPKNAGTLQAKLIFNSTHFINDIVFPFIYAYAGVSEPL